MATVAELQAQMAKNSAAWYGADANTQNSLHNQNLALQKSIDKAAGTNTAYNAATGTYAPATAGSNGLSGYVPLSNYNDAKASNEDSAAITALQNQWAQAKASGAAQAQLDAIHNQAEQLRSQYGYSGGVDGSQFNELPKEQQPQYV